MFVIENPKATFRYNHRLAKYVTVSIVFACIKRRLPAHSKYFDLSITYFIRISYDTHHRISTVLVLSVILGRTNGKHMTVYLIDLSSTIHTTDLFTWEVLLATGSLWHLLFTFWQEFTIECYAMNILNRSTAKPQLSIRVINENYYTQHTHILCIIHYFLLEEKLIIYYIQQSSVDNMKGKIFWIWI